MAELIIFSSVFRNSLLFWCFAGTLIIARISACSQDQQRGEGQGGRRLPQPGWWRRALLVHAHTDLIDALHRWHCLGLISEQESRLSQGINRERRT